MIFRGKSQGNSSRVSAPLPTGSLGRSLTSVIATLQCIRDWKLGTYGNMWLTTQRIADLALYHLGLRTAGKRPNLNTMPRWFGIDMHLRRCHPVQLPQQMIT